MSIKGKKIMASTIHVVAAKKYGSNERGLEFAIIGCIPTNNTHKIPKNNPFT